MRIWLFLIFMTLFAACDRVAPSSSGGSTGSSSAGGDEESAANVDEENFTTPAGRKLKKGKEVKPPDLTAAAKSPQFQAAIKRASELTGAQSKPFEGVNDQSDAPTGGVVFSVPHEKVEKSLDQWRKDLLPRGAYLVRVDNHFGINGGPDELLLLPTTDKYIVLAVVQTDGVNYGIMTGDIIEWLKDLEKTQPFDLTEAGLDFLACKFTTPLKDPKTLAKQMYDFCPDIVEQGTGDVEKLESELAREGRLFFWWD
jgi:hypothetical protein